MKNIRTTIALALTTSTLIGGTTAFAQLTSPRFSSVSGTVTYRQRSALPPNALVIIDLRNVPPKNTAAQIIGQKTIGNPGQVPIPFEISYDTSRIDPNSTYTVDARIIVDNRVRFRNTSAYPVITQGNPNKVEVVVEPVK